MPQVNHAAKGPGHTGARKFKKLMPALRWQNPEADIRQQWAEGGAPSVAVVTLADGVSHEIDLTGMRSEHILGEVLQVAGASAEAVDASVAWADEFLRPPVRASPVAEMEAGEALMEGDEAVSYSDESNASVESEPPPSR